MAQTRRANTYHASTRTLWGLAKSPELALEKEDLYGIIYRETGKEHMRDLSQHELDQVAYSLMRMKDGAAGGLRYRRTDEGGNATTVAQRHKIYMLTEELGWNDDNRRISAFAKRITGVDRLEWLSVYQCNMVIEALKAMVGREATKNGKQ